MYGNFILKKIQYHIYIINKLSKTNIIGKFQDLLHIKNTLLKEMKYILMILIVDRAIKVDSLSWCLTQIICSVIVKININ